MPGVMADNDVERQFQVLLGIMQGDALAEFWSDACLSVCTFESLGLPRDLPDRDLWQICQKNEIVLVTGNRNQQGPASLEGAIRELNTPQSLPVITLANPRRVLDNKAYAQHTAEKLLVYLVFRDKLRGSGRLYVP